VVIIVSEVCSDSCPVSIDVCGKIGWHMKLITHLVSIQEC